MNNEKISVFKFVLLHTHIHTQKKEKIEFFTFN